MTAGEPPISSRNCGAKTAPRIPIGTAAAMPSAIDCTADRAAPSGSFSPIRRATVAAAPIESPIASE